MVGIFITAMLIVSIMYSIYISDFDGISKAALEGGSQAVELCLSLAGSMALWGGVMNVCERCGIAARLTKLVSKPLRLLFRGLDDSKALELISLNVTANLLGLGNAATPLGIKAMKQLCRSDCHYRHTAAFILLNTASIQLIPVTISTLRLEHGAGNPWDCAVPTLLTSVCAAAAGLTAVFLIYPKHDKSMEGV